MTTAKTLDFYFDLISPFGYFASQRIDALAAAHGYTVRWRPLLIGVTVMKVMGSRPLLEIPLKGDYIVREAERYLRRHGMQLARGIRQAPINPLPVMRAMAWLVDHDAAAARTFALACLDAYWRQGIDLTTAESIAQACRSAELDMTPIDAALAAPDARDALHRQVDEAIGLGVFGSPFFLVGDAREPFFGVTSMETLEDWLASGGW